MSNYENRSTQGSEGLWRERKRRPQTALVNDGIESLG